MKVQLSGSLMTVNPYAPPRTISRRADMRNGLGFHPLRALGRWTLVCSISAAPSFFWACGLHQDLHHIAAMVCGIGVFVLAYTMMECTRTYQRIIELPYVRRTALIGYGTRVAISIIFPIGLALDVFVGMCSVALVEGPLLIDAWTDNLDYSASSFLVVFLTTVVQGLFLNALLMGYMLLVYAAQRLVCERTGRALRSA